VAYVGADEFSFSAEFAQLANKSLTFVVMATGDDDTVALPSCAKAKAAARPMPVSAPVINTTGVLIVPLL
jgi:hypothetical protein